MSRIDYCRDLAPDVIGSVLIFPMAALVWATWFVMNLLGVVE